MELQRIHHMTHPEATAWVDDKMVEMLKQFDDSVSGVKTAWDGNVLKFEFRANRIAKFRGRLEVTDKDLRLDLPFPLLARAFEGRARTEINTWLDQNVPAS